MRRNRALLCALAATSALIGSSLTPAPAASVTAAERACAPGCPGDPVDASGQGGDAYFPWDGNAGYDVQRYRIRATFTPEDGRLEGTTKVHARAGADPLRSFSLDLALRPDLVVVDGVAATFDKPTNHELRVTPAVPIGAGADFTVRVGYGGRPARVTAAGVSPFLWQEGEAMAVGEPQIGAWWFAANETPEDKAAFDVTLRVPRGQQAVSNGHLEERRVGQRWTTWRWRQRKPIVTYLAFFAAGRFELRQSVEDGRATVYAVSRRLPAGPREQSFRLLALTPGIIRWVEEWLGRPYPYGTGGGVIHSLWAGFALENAGRPTYPFVGGPASRWNVSLLVHEVAHQWLGNDVGLRVWRDIWLNEGLASYVEWAYAEDVYGDSVEDQLAQAYATYPEDSTFWQVVLSDPRDDRIFDEAVYERGAMTVAALRCRIGEADLATLLQRWVSDNAGGHGTMQQFRDLAEEVSGEELSDFFAEWLDQPDRPAATLPNGLSCA